MLGLLDPGRDRLVAAIWIMPDAREDIAVLAKGTPVVRCRTPLSGPDREGVALQIVVDVVDGVARAAVEAALYLLARRFSEQPLVPDDLEALDLLPVLLPEVDALEEEEAALHPLVGHRPPHVPGHLPLTDQRHRQTYTHLTHVHPPFDSLIPGGDLLHGPTVAV